MNIYMMAGIPVLIVGVLALALLLGSKTKTVAKMRLAKASANLANANYYRIKEKLTVAKILVRLRFRLLVGPKRFKDYTYQG